MHCLLWPTPLSRHRGSAPTIPLGQLSLRPSTYVWPPCPTGPRCANFSEDGFQGPVWLQEPSEHLALTRGPVGGLGELRLQSFGSKLVRRGRSESAGSWGEGSRTGLGAGPTLPGTAPATCPLSVPAPPAPEPLPSTVQGPARSRPLSPLQNPEA